MTELHNCRTEVSTATAYEQSVNVATTSLRTMGRKVIARSQETQTMRRALLVCEHAAIRRNTEKKVWKVIYICQKNSTPFIKLYQAGKFHALFAGAHQSTLVLSIWINIWVILICGLRFTQWCCRRLESSGFDTQDESAKDTLKRKLTFY